VCGIAQRDRDRAHERRRDEALSMVEERAPAIPSVRGIDLRG
jgi:hypothetical protein